MDFVRTNQPRRACAHAAHTCSRSVPQSAVRHTQISDLPYGNDLTIASHGAVIRVDSASGLSARVASTRCNEPLPVRSSAMKITLVSTYTHPIALGLRFVSAYLKAAGHEVQVLFMSSKRDTARGDFSQALLADFVQRLRDSDLIGMSLM